MAKSGSKLAPKVRSKAFVSSGNIFNDLGHTRSEAVNLLVRAKLMLALTEIIEEKKWTQQQAAHFLGVTQPRVSALMTGKIDKFTVDMLMKWLDKLGKEVRFSIANKRHFA